MQKYNINPKYLSFNDMKFHKHKNPRIDKIFNQFPDLLFFSKINLSTQELYARLY